MYCVFFHNALDHFFKFWPRQHHKPAAALTLDAEIHTCTQNLPQIAAAGMFLFHTNYIANIILYPFQTITAFSPPRGAFNFCLYCNGKQAGCTEVIRTRRNRAGKSISEVLYDETVYIANADCNRRF